MNLLQAPYPYRVADPRGDGVGGGAGTAHRRDAGDAIRHRAAADGLLIQEGRSPGGGATLFLAWEGHLHQPTKDFDLLGFGSPDVPVKPEARAV